MATKTEDPQINKQSPTKAKNEMEKYEVIKLLGEGSFGRVYKAKVIADSSFVALKIISKGRRSNKEIVGLRKECEIQRHLHHPNIIHMIESFETTREIVVVTEFAQKELHMLLGKEGFLNEEKAQPIMCDLVSALHYLHSYRVLHRDLKPQNVLIDSKNRAKLCDFGFARNMSAKTHVLTSIKGTPLYMAPELIEEQPYDYKAELWSLGCIMYEILVGSTPFCSAASLLHLIRLIRFEQITWPTNLTEDCLGFLKGLLQKESAKRFTWQEILEHTFIKGKILIYNSDTANSATNEGLSEKERQDSLVSKMQDLNVQEMSDHLQIIEESRPIEAEEWVAFLQKTMKEVINEELASLIQPSLLTIIISPMRNSNSDSKVLTYVVKLLSLPFALQNMDESITQILKTYREVKILPNLMYSSKLLLRKKCSNTTECSTDTPDMSRSVSDLNEELFECLDHIYRLITYLCYLDNGFTSQTCDAIVILKMQDNFKFFLKLSKSKSDLAAHIVAILTQILRMFPENVDLVERIVLQDEVLDFVELLRDNNPLIRERTCFLLLFLGRLLPAEKMLIIWNNTLKEILEVLVYDSCEMVRNVAEGTVKEFSAQEFYRSSS